ncbi:MAG TPA: DNA polymerase IV, partial [Burkholderiales bacterium]|nr:DNA polymerase IV [Burkholderiales bacterium]
PRAGTKLEALGIVTIGQLAQTPLETLLDHFGPRHARWLIDAANGRDDRSVVTSREPKSLSRETTFEHDLDAVRDRAELTRILLHLCERVSGDLQRKGYVGKTIGVKLRYADFQIATRDSTIAIATSDPRAILGAARECLKRVPLDRRLRLLGVRVAALTRPESSSTMASLPAPPETLGLFGK